MEEPSVVVHGPGHLPASHRYTTGILLVGRLELLRSGPEQEVDAFGTAHFMRCSRVHHRLPEVARHTRLRRPCPPPHSVASRAMGVHAERPYRGVALDTIALPLARRATLQCLARSLAMTEQPYRTGVMEARTGPTRGGEATLNVTRLAEGLDVVTVRALHRLAVGRGRVAEEEVRWVETRSEGGGARRGRLLGGSHRAGAR